MLPILKMLFGGDLPAQNTVHFVSGLLLCLGSYMSVDLGRGLDISVAEESLDNTDILPLLDQSGGESVPEPVQVDVLDLCLHQEVIELSLEVPRRNICSYGAREDEIVVEPLPLPATLLTAEY